MTRLTGIQQIDTSGIFCSLQYRGDIGIHGLHQAIDLDNQHRFCPTVQGGRLLFANQVQRSLVNELQGTGQGALCQDANHGIDGRLGVKIGCADGIRAFRKGTELQSRLGDDGQDAFGTDQQACQVQAHHPFRGGGAGPDHVAGPGHRMHFQRILAAGPVLDRTRAGGIAGQIPPHGTVVCTARVRGPEQAMLESLFLHRRIQDTRFNAHVSIGLIHLQYPVHPFR